MFECSALNSLLGSIDTHMSHPDHYVETRTCRDIIVFLATRTALQSTLISGRTLLKTYMPDVPSPTIISFSVLLLPSQLSHDSSLRVQLHFTAMLVFFVLCTIFRTLQGAPVAPSLSAISAASDTCSILPCKGLDTPGVEEGNVRTSFMIVQSCVATVFACVWKAIHPNINGPKDSWWTRCKRKLFTTMYAMIAPEMVLYWALAQCSAAKETAMLYNKEFSNAAETKASFTDWFVGLFRPLSDESTRHSDRQRWSTTHGFFIQMGGFILHQNGQPTEVLDYDRLVNLIRKKQIDQPTITTRELQDRSKGDAISKGLVVCQTTWFALQCFARLAQHLPLSELEVITLAFTVVNVAIYAAWWDKPQSVDTAVWLPLKGVTGKDALPSSPASESDIDKAVDLQIENADKGHDHAQLSNEAMGNNPTIEGHGLSQSTALPLSPKAAEDDKLPLSPSSADAPVEQTSWLRCILENDRQKYGLCCFLLLLLPCRMITSPMRPIAKMTSCMEFDRKRLRVPMFHASHHNSGKDVLIMLTIGLVVGAIHLISWDSAFPTYLDQVLWRCAVVVLIAVPCVYFMTLATTSETDSVLNDILFYFYTLVLFLYGPARCVVIVVALRAIHDPTDGVLRDASWTSYIPHL